MLSTDFSSTSKSARHEPHTARHQVDTSDDLMLILPPSPASAIHIAKLGYPHYPGWYPAISSALHEAQPAQLQVQEAQRHVFFIIVTSLIASSALSPAAALAGIPCALAGTPAMGFPWSPSPPDPPPEGPWHQPPGRSAAPLLPCHPPVTRHSPSARHPAAAALRAPRGLLAMRLRLIRRWAPARSIAPGR